MFKGRLLSLENWFEPALNIEPDLNIVLLIFYESKREIIYFFLKRGRSVDNDFQKSFCV